MLSLTGFIQILGEGLAFLAEAPYISHMTINTPKQRFSDLCELVGCSPDEFITHFDYFITQCNDRGKLDEIPKDMRNSLFSFLQRARINDYVDDEFTRMFSAYVFLVSMSGEEVSALANSLEEDEDGEWEPIVEGIEIHDMEVQTLIRCSITLTEWARAVKITECDENCGPADFTATVAYFTLKEGVEADFSLAAIDADNFVINLGQVCLDTEGEDPFEVLDNMLAEIHAEHPNPVVIGFVCDSYMRTLDIDDNLYDGSLEDVDLSQEYFRPGTDVSMGLATIMLTRSGPAVSAVTKYAYGDDGLPVFGKCEYAVNLREDALRDRTQRGIVARVLDKYLTQNK